jgi:glycosyltransferase involved in cell wall biosynthesis
MPNTHSPSGGKLRIVLFYGCNANVIGGNTSYLIDTARLLSRRNVELHVLVPDGTSTLDGIDCVIHKYRIPEVWLPRGCWSLYSIFLLIQLYRSTRKRLNLLMPDVIISNHFMAILVAAATCKSPRFFLPGSLAAMDIKMDPGPSVSGLFRRWSRQFNCWMSLKFEKWALNLSRKIIVSSNFFSNLICETYGYHHRKHLEIIPNGVDVSHYGVGTRNQSIQNPRRVVLSAIRIVGSKNWRLILEAAPLLEPNVEWWIAGDGAELALLKTEVANRGLKEKVRVLERRKDMPDLYAQADVFVHLSYYDCYSMVVMEALVSGLPVVLLDQGTQKARIGYGEIARPEPGFTFVQDTASEVAKGIKAMLSEPLNKVAFAEKARAIHSHERHVDSLIKSINAELKNGAT